MYPWNNERRLDELQVDAREDALIFETGEERAVVYFDDRGIRSVHCTACGETVVDTPHHIVVGEHNWRRDVYHYLMPGGPAPRLRLGITRHRGRGTWSSLPHAFELRLEPGFEEVFFYLLEGGSQTAVQRGKGMWYDGTQVDAAWLVRHRSFSTIPMGYHPVVGEPGVQVAYIWAYLAKHPHWEKV